MKNTKIEWAHHTVNFWWGCAKVSLACMFCYAEVLAKLFSRGKATWGPTGNRWIRHEAARRELYALDLDARERGVRERVFINSMSDTFEDRDDLTEARERLWDACRNVSNLDILLLTKRPENIMEMVPLQWHVEWPAHVWIGTTVENRACADARIPVLLKVPARVRFLSCEPLLGPLDFSNVTKRSDAVSQLGKKALDGIHWVIVGGESGGHARPMHPDWARSIQRQCEVVGVPFFFKQWGEWAPGECVRPGRDRLPTAHWFDGWHFGTETAKQSESCHADDAPDLYRVGKVAAGRLLDGVECSAVPEVVE
jgi:protein gp37